MAQSHFIADRFRMLYYQRRKPPNQGAIKKANKTKYEVETAKECICTKYMSILVVVLHIYLYEYFTRKNEPM